MASHRLPSSMARQAGQGQQQEAPGRIRTNNEAFRAQSGPSRGSLNILSSILRGPLPGPRPPQSVTVSIDQSKRASPRPQGQGQRSVSPVRVITVGGSLAPVDPKSLSPSRTPTTLPPKKSMSPSRPIYSERQVHVVQHSQQRVPQLSPPQRGQIPVPRGPMPPGMPGQIIQITRSGQGEIPQPLLQQIPAEVLFQQYKMGGGGLPRVKGIIPEGLSQDMIALAEQAVNSTPRVSAQVILERRSPSSSPSQPKPAHQAEVSVTPPPHVSTIRRTPSPAHMPIGADVKPVRVVEVHAGGFEKQQAVNLSKPHERHPSGGWIYQQPPSQTKPGLESRMSEEFKYGDLLQSIQRSQDLQSQLLQRDLSPITPSDPLEPMKPWNIPQQQQHHQVSAGFDPQLHGRLEGLPPTSHGAGHQILVGPPGGFIPIPMSGSIPVSAISSSGLTRPAGAAQVFPSPGQRLASPKAQRVEPTGTVLHHATSPKTRVIHNPASSISTSGVKQPVVNLVRLSPGQTEVKVFPGRERSKYNVQASLASVTQPGPPNVTITTTSSIFPPEKTLHIQTMARNPFTFPATPPVSLANEFAHLGRNIQVDQSKASTETVDFNQKQRHRSDDMPSLVPIFPHKVKQEEEEEKLVPIPQPYNMRVQNLANLPNNSTYRATYRATSIAVHRAKAACITSAAKSLDILRQNLQKSINSEIQAVIQRYLDKFFKIGVENIKLNNGENSVSEEHVQAVCRQMLEEAKKMYTTDTGRQSVSPAREFSDNVSDAGSSGRRSALGRRRHPSDTDSEASLRAPGVKKKKGKPLSLTGRATPSKLSKEIWKREGPKFDPERLTESTRFVMGSKANKAMGFGATRGRLYMKHPDLFKYNGDQDDKTWLYEHHHMPATGGKSYLVVLDDVKELARSDEYRDQSGISINEVAGFCVPMWMIEKMRHQMMAMRTDLPKLTKHRSRSVTPNEGGLQEADKEFNEPKELPFASFSSPKASTAEAKTDEDMEFLAEAGMDETSERLSPFNMTGGFDEGTSDLDNLDDDTIMNPPI